MSILARITLRKSMETAYGDPHSIYLVQDDLILVETEHGLECATVTEKEKSIEKKEGKTYRIIRKCTTRDVERIEQNRKKEKEAYHICSQKIEQRKLEMRLTCVEYTFERKKLFIYYTAGGRVDFRQLIKDVGNTLHSKIQMIQIGVRDEAKMLGGYGPCGRASCCSTFLREFKPVGIDMIKDQGLALNPAKVSGLCGRLICCLGYEDSFYREMLKNIPKTGAKIKTPNGIALVKNIDIFKETIDVIFDDSSVKKYSLKELGYETHKKCSESCDKKCEGHKDEKEQTNDCTKKS